MAKYKISFGTFPGEEHIVEVEEPTTDYGALIDILIDRLEAEGRKDCFRDPDDTKELGGDIYEDEYVIGGNHGLLLYHGGNFFIYQVWEVECVKSFVEDTREYWTEGNKYLLEQIYKDDDYYYLQHNFGGIGCISGTEEFKEYFKMSDAA